MKRTEPQNGQAQSRSAARQGGGAALASPQGERTAQLEAMVDGSPQAQKLAGLAAMMNASPAMAAQAKLFESIHNSPRQMAQKKAFDAIHNSPVQLAQRKKFESLVGGAAQRAEAPAKPNNTGLPDGLKSGIENLSGISMDNVKVHYNSSQPAQLNALAYAQGTDIHVAPGQEQHLPHEAWHVVQQAQGRVQPTVQMKDDIPVNDDKGLEHEADVMGERAVQMKGNPVPGSETGSALFNNVRQRKLHQFSKRKAQASPTVAQASNNHNKPSIEHSGLGYVAQLSAFMMNISEKDEFLEPLKRGVTEVADGLLAKIGQSASACPYIQYWFNYYGGQDVEHIKEAVIRYVPAVANAKTIEEAVELVIERVRLGIELHLETGSLESVPEGIPEGIHSEDNSPSEIAPDQNIIQKCGDDESEDIFAETKVAARTYWNNRTLENLGNWEAQLRADRGNRYPSLPNNQKLFVTRSFNEIVEEKAKLERETGARKKRAEEKRAEIAQWDPTLVTKEKPGDATIIEHYTTPAHSKGETYFNDPLRNLDMSDDQAQDISKLYKALQAQPIAGSQELWRGTGHFMGGEQDPKNLIIDKGYKEEGFLSTSVNRGTAEGFKKGRHLIKITYHKSGREIPSLGENTGKGEEEVLFPAGVTFIYKGPGGNGEWHEFQEG